MRDVCAFTRGLFGLVACIVTLKVALWDVPLLTGLVMVCGPDRNRPGRLVCIQPSLPELAAEVALLVGSCYILSRLRPDASG